MTGYYDLWHEIKSEARRAVDKDKKGVRLTVPLKARQKASIDQIKASEVAKAAMESVMSEKVIPQDMFIAFEVFDENPSEFDALWFRSHCDDFITKLGEIAGSKTKPGCSYRCLPMKDERVAEITITWREVGQLGGLHGILF